MELFEKINRAFGGWYEGLFGTSDDVRPKDILRKILVALEEHRKEGFDNKVYVPNQYILEIAVDDPEEKEYLLSFLDREELETAIRRYCQQNHYHIRGGLDFTIKEVDQDPEAKKKEKVRVKCRYDSKLAAIKEEAPAPAPAMEEPLAIPAAPIFARNAPPEEDATVNEVNYGDSDEMGTVPAIASARLVVNVVGKPPYEYAIAKRAITIGRSPRANNDIVLPDDGMISRRHARIELDSDGQFTVYDIDTTNGTRVNGQRIDNKALKNGDEIIVGATRILFYQDAMDTAPLPQASSPRKSNLDNGAGPRLVLTDGTQDLDDFVLATETVIGRGVTNDIVLPDRSVATRHARIIRGEPTTLQVLDPDHLTLLNGAPVNSAAPAPIKTGDRIGIGTLTLRFEEGRS
jgi:pSer/pThr/pTyr-binding forkhead associated (FHA) protein